MDNTKLTGLLDATLLGEIIKKFFEPLKSPVYVVDSNGEILAQSKELPFFCQIINSTKSGPELCKKCRAEYYEKAKQSEDKVVLYHCHAGLLNALVPVFINKNQMGAIICSAISKGGIDPGVLREVGKKINVDYEELADAFIIIPITSEENLKRDISLAYSFSNTIPELLFQKKISDKKVEGLSTLHKIGQITGSTTDLSDMMHKILELINTTPYFKNCSILISEGAHAGFLRFCIKRDLNIENFEHKVFQEVKYTNNIFRLNSINDYIKDGDHASTDYKVVALPLKINKEIIGCAVFYLDPIEELNDEELNFTFVFADQISMAVGNSQQLDQIKSKAITDQLTGLYNREFFMNALKRDMIRSIELRSPLSTAIIDLDDFKHYNDTYGHLKGDTLLSEVAKIIKAGAREKDIVGRYGGEEFIVIMPDTNSHMTFDILEDIRKKIEQKKFFGEESQPMGKITISAGIVTCMDKSLSEIELIKEADQALYKAKREGKNKIRSTVIVDRNLVPIDVQQAEHFNR